MRLEVFTLILWKKHCTKDCVIVPIPLHHFLPVTGSHHLRKWCEHYPEGLYRFVTQKSQNWSPKSEEVSHRDRHKILSFLLIFVGSCCKQVFSSLKMIFLNYIVQQITMIYGIYFYKYGLFL